MALLEVHDLEKWFGRRQVVRNVSFQVDAGQIVGMIGNNGAGKSTSFKMTIGLIDPDGGQVLFDGHDVTRWPMYRRARAGLGYLPQEPSIFKQLTVEKNLMAILETISGLSGRQRRTRRDELLRQFGLEAVRKSRAYRCSGGEKRRLEIARCMISEPKLIMLDEPFAAIDPITVAEIQEIVCDLARKHQIGILLTDHSIRETLSVTDQIYVIFEGTVAATGDKYDIINNPKVRRDYLGERFDAGHLLDRPPHQAIGGPDQPRPAPAIANREESDVEDHPRPITRADDPSPTPNPRLIDVPPSQEASKVGSEPRHAVNTLDLSLPPISTGSYMSPEGDLVIDHPDLGDLNLDPEELRSRDTSG